MLLLLLLNTLFAFGFVVTKSTLAYAPPLFMVASRMVLGGIILCLYEWYRGIKQSQIVRGGRSCIVLFCIATVCNIYLTNVLEGLGLQYVAAAKAALIYTTAPFFSAFISYIWLNETMTVRKWVGLFIGMLGLLLVLVPDYCQHRSHTAPVISLAELTILGAAIATVVGWISVKKLVAQEYSIFFINGVTMTTGGLMALGTSWMLEPWSPIPVTDYGLFAYYTLLGVLIYCIICYNIYGYLLKRYSATFMAFTNCIVPLMTALFGWLVLGEGVTGQFFIAFILVIIGLYLFYREELS